MKCDGMAFNREDEVPSNGCLVTNSVVLAVADLYLLFFRLCLQTLVKLPLKFRRKLGCFLRIWARLFQGR